MEFSTTVKIMLVYMRYIAISLLVILSFSSIVAQANSERKEEGFWKTDRAKLLDSEEFTKAISAAKQKEAKNGQPKKTDTDAAVDQIIQIVLLELGDNLKSDKTLQTNIETVLTTLGAITGFSCQMAGREALIETGKAKEKDLFIEVKTKNGKKFYFGDFINKPLVEAKPVSVWIMVGGAAQKLGAKSLPDINAIFKHSAQTVGSDSFGVPLLPEEHKPYALPVELLNKYWNPIRNILALHTDNPLEWPFILGLATQKAMLIVYDEDRTSINVGNNKEIALITSNNIAPSLAAKIVMESAVPMSKIDPSMIHQAYLNRP